MKKIRTRYAPSPTGHLHIGGARTALFSYLFAKHYRGDFIIRIEDTDIKRNVKNGESSQIKNLSWIGVNADESPIKPNAKYSPYRQSERIATYTKYINILLKNNYAYYAFDTLDELASQKQEQLENKIPSFRYDSQWLKISNKEKQKRFLNNEYVIRLKLPKNMKYSWIDLVRGNIEINSNDIGDFVIQKQDGYPTYNFACVIDDYLMEISHVFRGEEHISNTPKQLAIFKMFNWDVPKYGHFTIITNLEGKKLSKRDKTLHQFIEDYKNEGYLPHAIFNFLSLLGWSPKHTKEIMMHKEIVNEFDIFRMSKSPSKFDIKKLQWFSNQYFKTLNSQELKSILLPHISKLVNDKDDEWINLLLETYQKQIYASSQIQTLIKPIFELPSLTINMKKLICKLESQKVINEFSNKIIKDSFTLESISKIIKDISIKLNVKGKDLFMPIRIAISHCEHGPELNKTIYLIGRDTIIKRVRGIQKIWI